MFPIGTLCKISSFSVRLNRSTCGLTKVSEAESLWMSSHTDLIFRQPFTIDCVTIVDQRWRKFMTEYATISKQLDQPYFCRIGCGIDEDKLTWRHLQCSTTITLTGRSCRSMPSVRKAANSIVYYCTLRLHTTPIHVEPPVDLSGNMPPKFTKQALSEEKYLY